MSFILSVHVFGLCLVKESADSNPHRVIAIDPEDKEDLHHCYIVVPAINIDTSMSTLDSTGPIYDVRYFELPKKATVYLDDPTAGGLTSVPNDPEPATTVDLGLGPMMDGVGQGSWIDGELGRLPLQSTNARKVWIKKLGDKYKFPAVGGAARDVADAFIWQGKYDDAFRLTVTYEESTPKHLTLKSALGTDFKIGFGCVPKEESGSPFGYWTAYSQLTKGGGKPAKPEEEKDREARLFDIRHVGSSSCPPVKGG